MATLTPRTTVRTPTPRVALPLFIPIALALALVAPVHAAPADCAAKHLTPADQFTCLDARRKRLEREHGALLAGLAQRVERDALSTAKAKQAYLKAMKASDAAWAASRSATCALVTHAWSEADARGREVAAQRCAVEELAARIAQLERITGATPIASMLEVPIEVSSRRALLGPGHVVRLVNLLDEPLTLRLTLLRNAAGEKNHHTVTVEPSAAVEIGHGEGLPFAPGDELVVESGEYLPLRARIRD